MDGMLLVEVRELISEVRELVSLTKVLLKHQIAGLERKGVDLYGPRGTEFRLDSLSGELAAPPLRGSEKDGER
jgi:hypothetical protein